MILAHIVLPNDLSVGEWFIDQALPQIARGLVPALLPGGRPAGPPPAEQPEGAEYEVKG
jgi:hypothetical protein